MHSFLENVDRYAQQCDIVNAGVHSKCRGDGCNSCSEQLSKKVEFQFMAIKQASNLFTLRCAWGDAPSKKPANGFRFTDSVGQHRSHYQLRVLGALRLSTGVVSDSFFESDTTASEAVGSRRIQQNPVEKNRSD